MGNIGNIFKTISKNGFSGAIKAWVRYKLGITDIERQNESLYYLLNNSIDITKIPKTNDYDLRMLQKCDLVLLAIVDKLFNDAGITYWLDYGTLLGAIRHRGFIPWDDDIDISVSRNDYNNIHELLGRKIEGLGLKLECGNGLEIRSLMVSYLKEQTGVWVDIFPVDQYSTIDGLENARPYFQSLVAEYRNYYWKNIDNPDTDFSKFKTEVFKKLPKGNRDYIIHTMETWVGNTGLFIHFPEDIYPIRKCQFEDFSFSIPANPNKYIEGIYGGDYMTFPRIANNTHGCSAPLSKRAKQNGIDMNEVYNKLLEIYQSL